MKKSKTQFLKLMALFLTLFSINQPAFAQGQEGHGGNLTEGDLKYFITKLTRYLDSDEGKNAFPELVAYDLAHPTETIHLIATQLNPTIQGGSVFDSFGIARDCVSYFKPLRYFKCNGNSLPNNTLENQPSFYRLVFHEILVQAGVEKQLNNEVPSEYPIASRLDVHLETIQEWVPGKKEKKNIECYEDPSGKIESALLLYAKLGQTDCFEKFTDRRFSYQPNLEIKDELSRTPLNIAASLPRGAGLGIVQLLIQRKVNLENKDIYGLTPLTSASYSSPSVAKALVEAGANVNPTGGQIQPVYETATTPLTDVVDLPLAELLIARGADVDKSSAILVQTRWAASIERELFKMRQYKDHDVRYDVNTADTDASIIQEMERIFKFIQLYADHGGSIESAKNELRRLARSENIPAEKYRTYQFLLTLKQH